MRKRGIEMTPMEILSKIVEAEASARQVFNEAETLEKSFDDYVSKHIEDIRKQYFDRAEEAVSQARQAETARAEREILRLEEKLNRALESDAQFYDSRREEIASKIFRLAVNTDA